MAISEFEIKRCEKLVGAYVERHRPPAHIRNQVDLNFRVIDQSIEIFEVRPLWNNPDKKIEEMQAKTTKYLGSESIWGQSKNYLMY
jgi:hypothetical protein